MAQKAKSSFQNHTPEAEAMEKQLQTECKAAGQSQLSKVAFDIAQEWKQLVNKKNEEEARRRKHAKRAEAFKQKLLHQQEELEAFMAMQSRPNPETDKPGAQKNPPGPSRVLAKKREFASTKQKQHHDSLKDVHCGLPYKGLRKIKNYLGIGTWAKIISTEYEWQNLPDGTRVKIDEVVDNDHVVVLTTDKMYKYVTVKRNHLSAPDKVTEMILICSEDTGNVCPSCQGKCKKIPEGSTSGSSTSDSPTIAQLTKDLEAWKTLFRKLRETHPVHPSLRIQKVQDFADVFVRHGSPSAQYSLLYANDDNTNYKNWKKMYFDRIDSMKNVPYLKDQTKLLNELCSAMTGYFSEWKKLGLI